MRNSSCLFSCHSISENVLQRHLHDSLLARRKAQRRSAASRHTLAEHGAVQVDFRNRRIEVVWHVERFGPELERLTLAYPEFPCQAHVDADASRTHNIPSTHSSICTVGRPHE